MVKVLWPGFELQHAHESNLTFQGAHIRGTASKCSAITAGLTTGCMAFHLPTPQLATREAGTSPRVQQPYQWATAAAQRSLGKQRAAVVRCECPCHSYRTAQPGVAADRTMRTPPA
jgi:hypothetical protein